MTEKPTRKQGLGKGLSALLEEMGAARPDPDAKVEGPAATLPVAVVEPSPTQPRRHFDEAALNELADSIRIKGILQPIIVRPRSEGRYEIVAGERRWRAAQLAGLHEIPVLIREMTDSDSFEAALIENIQRADLNPVEEAEGYQQLARKFSHTQETIATLTGKSRSHIANLIRILDLPDSAREMVRTGQLSLGHAKALLAARDPAQLAETVLARGFTVRQTEAAARASHQTPKPEASKPSAGRDPDLEALEAQIEDATGLSATIEAKGAAGTVRLRFSGLDQLDLIVARLSATRF
jgi:ParB family chromosome partitioning protein